MFGDDASYGLGATLAGMPAAFDAMLGFASGVGGVLFEDFLADHAFPFAEAAFTQAWVEGYVKSEKVGDGVSGLLGAEKVG